jgi:hypothetical protein
MNEQVLRPAHIAAAAVVLGGIITAVLPQHAPSLLRLVIVTAAAAAALYALVVNAPPTWWRSPFDRRVPAPWRRRGSGEVGRIRLLLGSRRQRIPGAPPLPPETLRLLQSIIRSALEREGLDPDDAADVELARGTFSPLVVAILSAAPLERPPWHRTLRADERGTADVVHRVLDELDRRTIPEPRTT